MAFPVALQLYSVRALLPQDYAGVIRRIAAPGYDGVEPAGFPGTTPQAAGVAALAERALRAARRHARTAP